MVVQTTPFVPPFIIGTIFLLGPAFAVTLFSGSDMAGAATALVIAIAALVGAQDRWSLSMVLLALRTVPFACAALFAVMYKITHSFAGHWHFLAILLAVGGVAQWRVSALIRSGRLVI